MSKPEKQSEKEKEEEALRVMAQNELVVFGSFVKKGYKPSWLHDTIGDALEKVERGEIKRLMLMVPPRHGKSELASILFPAQYLGRHPEKEIIVASYSAELAQDFGYKTRNLVNGEEYKELFNTRLRDDSKSKAKWLTQEGGGYTSVGVGGAITGRGADLFIIDDPVKNREEAESETIREKIWNWYTSTAYTRLEKGAAVVLIMTRWHIDDLAGRLLRAQEEGGDLWTVIKFPAIAEQDEKFRLRDEALWPEKYTIEDLRQTRKTIGPYDFQCLYQQEPIATANQEFKGEWFQVREAGSLLYKKTRNYLTIDTAISATASSDYTGLCDNRVDQSNFWNLRAWREKLSPTDLIDKIFTMHEANRYEKIGIEKTVYLSALKPFIDQEMRKRNKFLPIQELFHNNTQKEIRVRGLIPRYESRSVFHIKGECLDLEEELLTFPRGIHDDVADATAYQIQLEPIKADADRRRRKTLPPVTGGISLRMC